MEAKREENLPHLCLVKVTKEISVHLQAINKLFGLVPSIDIADKMMGPATAMQVMVWKGTSQAKHFAVSQVWNLDIP